MLDPWTRSDMHGHVEPTFQPYAGSIPAIGSTLNCR